MVIPSNITQNTSWSIEVTSADYPPSNGWTCHLALRGPESVDITLDTGSKTYSKALSAAETTYKTGKYTAVLYVTKNTDRYNLETSILQVMPDPLLADADTVLLTHAEKTLLGIEAAIEELTTTGQVFKVLEIKGRQVQLDLNDLLKLRRRYQREVDYLRTGSYPITETSYSRY